MAVSRYTASPFLIQRRILNCHDFLLRFGPRCRDFDNFTLDMQVVPETYGQGPGDFSVQTTDAVRQSQAISNEKSMLTLAACQPRLATDEYGPMIPSSGILLKAITVVKER